MGTDILLVEDNRADIVMLTEALLQAGLDYNIRVARNGQQALGIFDEYVSGACSQPDMIVLDLNLPRVSGYELLRILRSQPDMIGIPTVILTSSAWQDESTKFNGFDRAAFFQKPSMLADWITVAEAIDAYLRKEMSGYLSH